MLEMSGVLNLAFSWVQAGIDHFTFAVVTALSVILFATSANGAAFDDKIHRGLAAFFVNLVHLDFYIRISDRSAIFQGNVHPAPIEVTPEVSPLVEDTSRVGGQLVRGRPTTCSSVAGSPASS